MTKLSKQIEPISLCPNCNCMTKTIKGKCGKCGADKPDQLDKDKELEDSEK
jgi:hypothetical protein